MRERIPLLRSTSTNRAARSQHSSLLANIQNNKDTCSKSSERISKATDPETGNPPTHARKQQLTLPRKQLRAISSERGAFPKRKDPNSANKRPAHRSPFQRGRVGISTSQVYRCVCLSFLFTLLPSQLTEEARARLRLPGSSNKNRRAARAKLLQCSKGQTPARNLRSVAFANRAKQEAGCSPRRQEETHQTAEDLLRNEGCVCFPFQSASSLSG